MKITEQVWQFAEPILYSRSCRSPCRMQRKK